MSVVNPTQRSEQIRDHFRVYADFEEELSDAEMNAISEKEMDFIASLRERSDTYAAKAYLSTAQRNWLKAIAEGSTRSGKVTL